MVCRIRKSTTGKDQGFTLTELLVVILIIGILAAIAVPNFRNQRKKGVDATMKSDLTTASLIVETWINENPNVATIAAGGEFTSTNLGTGALLGAKVSTGNNLGIKPSAGANPGAYCLGVYNPSGTEATATGLRMQFRSAEGGILTTAAGDMVVGPFNCP